MIPTRSDFDNVLLWKCQRYVSLLNDVPILWIWRDLVGQNGINRLDDFTDIDSSSDTEEILNSDSDEENKLLYLTKMGYSEAKASIAMERCGTDSSIAELIDFICNAQMAKATNVLLLVENRKPLCNEPNYKKKRNSGYDFWKRNKQRKLEKKLLNEDDHAVHLLNPIIGFGVSTEPYQITQRILSGDDIGSPYFYYENVSTKLTERIRKALEAYDDEPPSSVHKYVLDECRKWNLIWVGRNKVAPLKPDEVEMLLGFPKNHTRGGGSARDMFPSGINVLYLFSGISDAEVAFYCLGISLKCAKTECSVIGGSRLVAGENNLSGDAYRLQHEISDNLS
ncbi:DNA (Cytosine-5)-methyltransferase DRM1/2 isoform 2 [Hibiscus syriacus]|uniref:DNA (Cytosine-5)-methyltransferase DRM1/2 isoform 2 n=1 Tax=Hibiscus syriacus TaxID=106335 RepID=A0A6A2Z6Y4_HIBSY|nr:DNA (Cytosine-5)-methyltransferase DRM1/2 isoform 2 [Hibiscus syriacus]